MQTPGCVTYQAVSSTESSTPSWGQKELWKAAENRLYLGLPVASSLLHEMTVVEKHWGCRVV